MTPLYRWTSYFCCLLSSCFHCVLCRDRFPHISQGNALVGMVDCESSGWEPRSRMVASSVWQLSLLLLLAPLLLVDGGLEEVDMKCKQLGMGAIECLHHTECEPYQQDLKFLPRPSCKRKEALQELKRRVCNKAEEGVCCSPCTLGQVCTPQKECQSFTEETLNTRGFRKICWRGFAIRSARRSAVRRAPDAPQQLHRFSAKFPSPSYHNLGGILTCFLPGWRASYHGSRRLSVTKRSALTSFLQDKCKNILKTNLLC